MEVEITEAEERVTARALEQLELDVRAELRREHNLEGVSLQSEVGLEWE